MQKFELILIRLHRFHVFFSLWFHWICSLLSSLTLICHFVGTSYLRASHTFCVSCVCAFIVFAEKLSAGGFATAGAAGGAGFGSSDPNAAAGGLPEPPGSGFGSNMPLAAANSQALAMTDPTVAGRLQQLPNYVAGVMSADPSQHLECTTQFRKLLSIERNPPIQQVSEGGGGEHGDAVNISAIRSTIERAQRGEGGKNLIL